MEDINCWELKFESCIYSDKLLNKLTQLNKLVKNPADLRKIKKACYYARKYHGPQMRQSGEPYYSHPLEVTYLLAHYTVLEARKFFKTDLLVTALLHDTLEDTTLTKNEIARIFDNNIANHVEDLTRIKINTKISAAEAVMLLHQQKNDGVLAVKLFDRLHNIQTINAKSPEKIKKIMGETVNYFILLAGYLEMRQVEHELLKLCAVNMRGIRLQRKCLIKNCYRQPLSLAFQNVLYSS